MLNLRKRRAQKNIEFDGFIQLVLLQWKMEYSQLLIKPHKCQYTIKSKLYGC